MTLSELNKVKTDRQKRPSAVQVQGSPYTDFAVRDGEKAQSAM